MKSNPSKSNGNGAKKKNRNDSVLGSIGHAAKNAGNAYSKYIDVQKNIAKSVLPVEEVKRIAKGKGTKSDYVWTGLAAAPFGVAKLGKYATTGAQALASTVGITKGTMKATGLPTGPSKPKVTPKKKK